MAKTPEFDPRKPRKNYFINGDMSIAQRGTSFAAIANNTYSLDRMNYIKSGAMVHTVTQDTDVPTFAQSGYFYQNSIRLNLTTPDTSIAATDFCAVGQIIEGYHWKALAQKPFTISFWVKATLPGTYCIGMQNSAADRGYAVEYTIDAASTWEYKTVTVPASITAGTWNYTNGVGLKVWFVLAAGTNFHFATGSWQTGVVLSTASQVNGVNTGAADFRMTGLCINEGSEAIAFKPFGDDFEGELAACQRYYEKSYDLDVFAGAITAVGAWFETTSAGVGTASPSSSYKVIKRATPTVIVYNPVTGASNNVRVSTNNNAFTLVNNGTSGFNGNVANGADTQMHWQFTAEAELS